MTFLTLAQIAFLLGAALSLALRNNVHRAWAGVVSQLIGTTLTLVCALPVLLGDGELRATVPWSYPVESVTAHLDALGAFFLVWSLPMTLMGTLYAVGYLRPQFASRNAGVQFALLNITSFSFVLIYTLENAMVFLLGWEIAAVAAWLLVIWEYRSQKTRFAGFNYLVSTHVGFFVLVAAFMTMRSATGSMDFGSFSNFLRIPSPMRNVTFILLATSFGLKAAFFPFHTWLPRAHSAAPAHVSALMSGVIHKAGLFGLLRFTLLIGAPDAWMGWYLLAFSSLTALVGVLYTTAQRDLKRLLGYSSTENVGIAGIGFGLGYLGLSWHKPVLVALGFTGGILHILNHAVFKCLLFYAAGSIYRATHTVDLERLGGLIRKLPWTAFFFLLGGLAISGLPPLNGFVSEFLIYAGLLHAGAPSGIERALLIGTASLLALVGGASALATVRAFGVSFLGTPRDTTVHADHDASLSMRLTMCAHAVGVVLLGVVPAVALRIVRAPAALFMGPASAPPGSAILEAAGLLEPVAWTSALLLAVFLVLLVGRWWLLRGRYTKHVTWGCGYTGTTSRMQTTGTSFSAQFASSFESVLHFQRRERLPVGFFPESPGHLDTYNVDTVERRIFEALGEGQDFSTKVVARISEEPRFAFGLGLVVLVALVVSVFVRGDVP